MKFSLALHGADVESAFTAPPVGRRKLQSSHAVSFHEAALNHVAPSKGAARHAAFFSSSAKPRTHVAFATTEVEPFMTPSMVKADAAESSSVYGTGTMFTAQQALNGSRYYWCSSGNHKDWQTVTWTGVLDSRRKVSGAKIRWAQEYSPNEMKVLTSSDGEHFSEASCWKEIGNDKPEFNQTLKFDHPVSAKAISIVMRGPGPAGYFGINQVAMLGDRDSPLMVVNGVKEAEAAGAEPPGAEGEPESISERILSKHECLVAEDESSVGMEKCQTALLSSDAGGVFKFNEQDQLEHAATGKCVVVSNVSPDHDGQVELKDCLEGEDDEDFQWDLNDKGQLKSRFGDYCLLPANPLKATELQGGTVRTTSSMAGHPASSVVDGDKTSYWASAMDPPGDVPVELTVDLGGEKSVANVEIDWEYPAKAFDVQVSTDGAWTTIYTTSNNSASSTKISASDYPAEIMHRLGSNKLAVDSKLRLDSKGALESSKQTTSPELPHNSTAVRVLMREPHPDWGIEKGHSLYGIRSVKVSASGSKEMIVKECNAAEAEAGEDKRDKWFLEAAAPVNDTARKKIALAQINFL